MLADDLNASIRAMASKCLTRWMIRPFTFVVLVMTASCDDPFAVFLQNVPAQPSETTLFDFIGGRLQDPPAFDVIRGGPVRPDQSRNWDFLFQIIAGTPEFAPFSAVTDSVTDSGLRSMENSFEGVLEAPTGGYILADPVSIKVGDVLVARSRTDPTSFLSCSRYAKLEVLELDVSRGSVTFRHLSNPNCGDTVLEPGKHGSI